MRPGIHVVVAFHGQHYGRGSRARADGNDNHGRNARTPTQTPYTSILINTPIWKWPAFLRFRNGVG